MRILVTGGAGYIGSHFVHAAVEAGHDVLVVDNLERGHGDAVDRRAALLVADIRDAAAIGGALRRFPADAVVHFAALAYAGESVEQPERYHDNNVVGTATLLSALRLSGSRATVVFSSSCTVYGNAARSPIVESATFAPVSPYGETKVACERLLSEHCAESGTAGIALRYFNAAGAHLEAGLGERHDPEPHLIPVLIEAARAGRGVTIFGNDYDTVDGTCVRDYVHVRDLASAHLAASAVRDAGFDAMNLGSGVGSSNLDVVRAVERRAGRPLAVTFGARRPGDAAALFADSRKAQAKLGFSPGRSALDSIIDSAWAWHARTP